MFADKSNDFWQTSVPPALAISLLPDLSALNEWTVVSQADLYDS